MRSIGRYACALDIDGVLVRGNKPIKGALESIKLLQSHRIPFVCLTNGMSACITDQSSLCECILIMYIYPFIHSLLLLLWCMSCHVYIICLSFFIYIQFGHCIYACIYIYIYIYIYVNINIYVYINI